MTLDIFIPYWGEPSLLYETVDSVRAQTNPAWRLTVIDDCYPDESVPAYFANLGDDRVTYLRNAQNQGITANFQQSVNRATAEFVAIVGSDDALLPNYVDTINATIRAVPNADIIQPGVRVIDEQSRPGKSLTDAVKQRILAPKRRNTITALTGQRLATSLIRGDWLYWPSLTFRTSTIQGVPFRDGFPIIQDLALLMDLAFAGAILAYNPTPAFLYRRHADSASQKTLLDGERFDGERRYYRLAADLADAQGWGRTRRAARSRVVSRLHAVTTLPLVLRKGTPEGRSSAMRHIFT